jgi:NAD(P)-dependent dehydrogenase (short-subunit alcohol dehydrogenase family)
LDILVNNAGIVRRETIEETSQELWDRVLSVNATGVFLGTKTAIPAMRRAGGGSIINISSISGMLAVGAPAYGAAKGAVRVLPKVTAIQPATDTRRCNAIHPGPIDTPMIHTADPDWRARASEGVPLGRVGTAEDVAYGVLYLASDEAAYITGSELVIDGGYAAQ